MKKAFFNSLTRINKMLFVAILAIPALLYGFFSAHAVVLQSSVVFEVLPTKNVFHLGVNTHDNGIDQGNLSYTLLYRNENVTDQIESAQGSSSLSQSNFSQSVDAATCSSGGTCVPHKVSRGIFKVRINDKSPQKTDPIWYDSRWFTLDGQGVVTFVFEEVPGSMNDMSDAEKDFLLNGNVPKPTATPTIREDVKTTPTLPPEQCGVGGGDHLELDQYANTDEKWQHGDLNKNNSAYNEGDSVPYRYSISGLNPGMHTVHLNYEFTHLGVFAFDYLTTYNASENAGVCDGLPGSLCGSSVSPLQVAIPMDPDTNVVNQMTGQFVQIFGATSGNLGVYSLNGSVSHNSDKDIVLTFYTDAAHPDVLIAWGGHLASSLDHGTGMGAGSIEGAPFHMSAQYLDCNGTASMDRSIQPGAIGPYPYASIIVDKVTDPSEDPQLFDFVLTMPNESTQGATLADQTPPHTFEQLAPGTYTLEELALKGWDLVSAVCTDRNEREIDPSKIVLGNGDVVTCVFTNQKLGIGGGDGPVLQITKENDATTDKHNGDTVTYTLTVTALRDVVNGVAVKDLPPGGFVYQLGTWTADSSVRGDLKTSLVTPEPTYHSPGTWQLGTMTPGEVVTLTYKATITDPVLPGLYRDVAWADGTSQSEARVLADAQPLGYVAPVFVGTQVNIVKEQQQTASVNIVKTEVKNETSNSTSNVLGASTTNTLPSTGAETAWIILAGLCIAFGLGSMTGGVVLMHVKQKTVNKKAKKVRRGHVLVMLLVGFVLWFGLPSVAHAAVEPTSIRIETPKSPTYLSDFSLNFVTLDVNGQTVVVKCFKKGPSDLTYVQFGSDITVIPGGNTNYCTVNASVLPVNGTYQFYTTADVPGYTATSQVVSVDYNTSGPGTPTNYSKDTVGCGYRINFRTADDGGKTVKAEVYRSENTSFDLNDSTRVYTTNVSSNTDVSYVNTVPVCGKTYYYAVRAFDAAGNGSGSIGDTVTQTTVNTTTTSSSTTTTGSTTTTTTTQGQTGGAIAVSQNTLPPSAEGGAVEGTSTEGQPSSENANGGSSTAPETPSTEVLGASTTKTQTDSVKRMVGFGILGLVLGMIGYAFYKKTTKKAEQNEPTV